MQYVYSFKEDTKDKLNLLGKKATCLIEMINLGLPIPDGFTITTKACHDFYKNNNVIPQEIEFQILSKLKNLEESTKKTFGGSKKPLLVSVRCSNTLENPGAKNTILNVGINDEITEELARKNPRMAYDTYRRFIEQYAEIVMNYDPDMFSNYFERYKNTKGYKTDLEFTEEDYKILVSRYKDNYLSIGGEHFPQDPKEQLFASVSAIFKSWNDTSLIKYKSLEQIEANQDTGIIIEEMVYGNLNERSGVGFLSSRNTMTGEDKLYGEYLINAQGTDLINSSRIPNNIEDLAKFSKPLYGELFRTAKFLEKNYKEVQEIEFTIENEKLYILNCKTAKSTTVANIVHILSLIKERAITEKEAILRINPDDLEKILMPTFDQNSLKRTEFLAKGIPASPGATVGKIVFNSEEIKSLNDKDSILVRKSTNIEDVECFKYANGVITKNGGLSSHAAIIARSLGVCSVVGLEDIKIDYKKETITIGNKTLSKGDYISIDGTTGNIYKGKVPLEKSKLNNQVIKDILKLIKKYDYIQVRANVDSLTTTKQALNLGADGIGLVRTENLFIGKDRTLEMRKMILSNSDEERNKILDKIERYQEEDFYNILKEVNGLPIIIRYFDPPLHEFLPKESKDIIRLAKEINIPLETLEDKLKELKETNPMMGLRGCRLAIKYPEISIMQTKALTNAMIKLQKEKIKTKVQIMIPLTVDIKEFVYIKGLVDNTIKEILKETGCKIDYKVGTMIETPRAALMSQLLSKFADFYSFGTNDLTQLTYGFSRDDVGLFLQAYEDKNIFEDDPFKTLDKNGVGSLMQIAMTTAIKKMETGICGEHSVDKESIRFAKKLGIDYVSCSPCRVPSARLIGAQLAIEDE